MQLEDQRLEQASGGGGTSRRNSIEDCFKQRKQGQGRPLKVYLDVPTAEGSSHYPKQKLGQNISRKTSMMERSSSSLVRHGRSSEDCRRHSFIINRSVREYSSITDRLERKISVVQAPNPDEPYPVPTVGSQLMLDAQHEAEKTVCNLMEGVIAERLGGNSGQHDKDKEKDEE